MKRLFFLLPSVLAAFFLFTACSEKNSDADETPAPLVLVDVAANFMAIVTSGDFTGILDHWAKEKKARLSEEYFYDFMRNIDSEAGGVYTRLKDPDATYDFDGHNEMVSVYEYYDDGFIIVPNGGGEKKIHFFYIQMPYSRVFLEVHLNADDRITDFVVAGYDHYLTWANDLVLHTPVTVNAGTRWELSGVLSYPAKTDEGSPVPAALLVPGLYPSDMDGTLYNGRMFYDIAEYLSRNGVAVLRYENRRYAHAENFERHFGGNETAWDDIIEDAINAAQILREDPRFTSVYMIGHGLSATLAPRIHAEGGNFDGLILIAGSVKTPIEYEVGQHLADPFVYERIPDALALNDQAAQFSELARRIRRMPQEEARSTKIPLLDVYVYYMQDLLSHPFELYAELLDIPVLSIHSTRDFQMPYFNEAAFISRLLEKILPAGYFTARYYLHIDHRLMLTEAGDAEAHRETIMTRQAERVDWRILMELQRWIYWVMPRDD